MTPVVPFGQAPDADNYRREQRALADAILDVWRHAGGRIDPLYEAITAYTSFMERRARALEHSCRALLTSEALTEVQRTDLLLKFFGRAATHRDMRVLSETERTLVLQYRALDAEAKQFVRVALKRLQVLDLGDADAEKGEQ